MVVDPIETQSNDSTRIRVGVGPVLVNDLDVIARHGSDYGDVPPVVGAGDPIRTDQIADLRSRASVIVMSLESMSRRVREVVFGVVTGNSDVDAVDQVVVAIHILDTLPLHARVDSGVVVVGVRYEPIAVRVSRHTVEPTEFRAPGFTPDIGTLIRRPDQFSRVSHRDGSEQMCHNHEHKQ